MLLGIDGAACRLRVSREALTLELAQPGPRTDAQVDALREGLLAAVRRMEDDGTLPPASELVDEALENADLNRFLEARSRPFRTRWSTPPCRSTTSSSARSTTWTCATSWRTSMTRTTSTDS